VKPLENFVNYAWEFDRILKDFGGGSETENFAWKLSGKKPRQDLGNLHHGAVQQFCLRNFCDENMVGVGTMPLWKRWVVALAGYAMDYDYGGFGGPWVENFFWRATGEKLVQDLMKGRHGAAGEKLVQDLMKVHHGVVNGFVAGKLGNFDQKVGKRIGEAANPGPQRPKSGMVSLARGPKAVNHESIECLDPLPSWGLVWVSSWNLTSWKSHFKDLVAERASAGDVWAVQETGLEKFQLRGASKQARKVGLSANFSGEDTLGFEGRGCAVLGSMTTGVPPEVEVPHQLLATGGFAVGVFPLGCGQRLSVISIRGGKPGEGAVEKEKRRVFFGKVFEYADLLGSQPVVVAGDFNDTEETSKELKALPHRGWNDLAELVAARTGGELAKTCWAGENGRRIDRIYGNLAACRAATSSVCGWRGAVPTHMCLSIGFNFQKLQQLVQVARAPKAIPLGKVEVAHREEAVKTAMEYAEGFAEAERDGEIDEMYRLASLCGERALVKLAELQGIQVTKDQLGRGKVAKKVWQDQFQHIAKVARSGDFKAPGIAHTVTQRKLTTQCRRLEKILYILGKVAKEGKTLALEKEARSNWEKSLRCDAYGRTLAAEWERWHREEKEKPNLVLNEHNTRVCLTKTKEFLQIELEAEASVKLGQFQDECNSKHLKAVYRYVDVKPEGVISVVKEGENSWTTSPARMEHLAMEFWQPIFQRHNDMEEGKFGAALGKAKNLLHAHGFSLHLQDFTPARWRQHLKTKRGSAGGSDGWSCGDLEILPDEVVHMFLRLMKKCEELGRWPKQLEVTRVSLLLKEEGKFEAGKLRPITVFTVIYRTWASMVMEDILAWLTSWAPPSIVAGLMHKDVAELWWGTSIQVEKAIVGGEYFAGFVADLVKAFNRIPRDIVFELAEFLGVPESIVKPWKGMMGQFKREFKIAGHIGKPMASSTGFPEGDPLSILAMIVVCIALDAELGEGAPDATFHSFADNWQVEATGEEAVETVVQAEGVVKTFVDEWDMEISEGKSWTFATHTEARTQLRKSLPYTVALDARDLGAHINYGGTRRAKTQSDRIDKAVESLGRLGRLRSLPDASIVRVVGGKILPMACYGAQVCHIPTNKFEGLVRGISKVLVRGKKEAKAAELTMHIYGKPDTDPFVYVGWQRIWMFRKMVVLHSAWWRVAQQLVLAYEGFVTYKRLSCPIFLLMVSLKAVGWRLLDNFDIEREGAEKLNIVDTELVTLRREWQSSARACSIAQVGKRRKYTEDTSKVDIEHTKRLSATLDFKERNVLRVLQIGAWMGVHQHVHAGHRTSIACRFCKSGKEETFEHLALHCKHSDFKKLREGVEGLAEAWSNLPKVTTEHGLVEFLPEEFVEEKNLYKISVRPLPEVRENRDRYGWWDVWGDGSSKPPADPKLCRSGVGLCDGDRLVHCEPLQGPRQTNPRAELMAMLRAASLGKKIRYHGDFLAGVTMAEARRLHGVAWPPVELMANGDIWKQWDTIEAGKSSNEKTVVVKVKGHDTAALRSGDLNRRHDHFRNEEADALANRGRELHRSTEPLRKKLAERDSRISKAWTVLIRVLVYLMDDAKAEAVEKDVPKVSGVNPKAYEILFGVCATSALEESTEWERLTIGNPIKQRNVIWAFGDTFRARLLQYLRLLKWPTKCDNGNRSITFLELLLDYEITYRTQLPVPIETGKKKSNGAMEVIYELPDESKYAKLKERRADALSMTFGAAMRSMEKQVMGKVMLCDAGAYKSGSLLFQGAQNSVAGLPVRPRLVNPKAVAKVIEALMSKLENQVRLGWVLNYDSKGLEAATFLFEEEMEQQQEAEQWWKKVIPFGEDGRSGKQAEKAAEHNAEAKRVGSHVFGFAEAGSTEKVVCVLCGLETLRKRLLQKWELSCEQAVPLPGETWAGLKKKQVALDSATRDKRRAAGVTPLLDYKARRRREDTDDHGRPKSSTGASGSGLSR